MGTSYYKTYGPVYSVGLVGLSLVILHGAETIKEAFHNKFICDRPSVKILKHVLDGAGVAFSSGEAWKTQRRIAMTFMRDFGLNRTDFEDQVAVEAGHLLTEVAKHEGRPFSPYVLMANAVSNVICKVVFGTRYDYDDPQFKRLLGAIYRNIQLIGGVTGALQVLPGAHVFARFLPPVRETGENLKLICEFTRDVLEEHKKDFDPEHPRDFIDVYLREMEASSVNKSNVNMNDMYATVGDLFVAGTEATSTSVRWGMIYMMAHPEIQQRVQDEIDSVVGRQRFPTMADRPRLPYTEAVMLEIFRLGNVVPLGAPHQASQDTTIGGYHISKGSLVFANLGMLGLDEKVFPEPDKFKPERFLDESGQLSNRKYDLLPFSTGPRMCIGEQMSRTELFVFFTRLIHRFTFRKPTLAPPISFKGVAGITWSPLPFEICAVPRK
ncbi:cytochrome P450 2J6-like isoform X2 [Acanthaster planci]|uniref:Cytochrome P450 2J6-like isoform X2 n=1 Tax=Acanthaster planci TaxID=133434 RepID=A0A8B7YJB1_ACAPL|nr:cytochrome P450 2J6-like isoform X2 [Acanthaster planci]